MKRDRAVAIFECLSSDVRLDIFRLLVRRGLDGEVAGVIAAELDVAANNLSFHLKGLAQVGLVKVQQEGRFQRYRANLGLMGDLVSYLTEECCGGDLTRCVEIGARKVCGGGSSGGVRSRS
ncbi:MAG: ArsR/SmtB family transcription factor [Pseudomonadota bacterium]|jgi:ArsR family transcriptional regulator